MNQHAILHPIAPTAKSSTQTFFDDVIRGLKSSQKRLNSMYFYDAVGDKIFQELMDCPEYYPTNCELEIFQTKTTELAQTIIGNGDAFDLIELGAGDATKSSYLLKYLQKHEVDFNYLPIDISPNVINYLNVKLPLTIPGLKITGLNGEYFDMLKQAASISNRRKVVLFMGSNIGNMPISDAVEFCKVLRDHLKTGDMAVIGFDLKKSPQIILAAYNDHAGITKRFNLNLLHRINRDLEGNFNVNQFDHYAMYDPESGACKSYLISLKDQLVNIGKETICFVKDEYIYMEI
ncbi:MAG: L-histidine N(alpha)-methyltransferase, partial [Bacteroidota bacterium]